MRNSGGSEEHQRGLLDELPDFREELGGDRAIDHAVIAGKSQIHAEAGHNLAVFDDGFFDGSTDGQNGGLRWVDDRVEGFDAPGSEVGNGDGAAVEFIGLEFLVLGTNGEVFDGSGNGEEGFGLGLFDDWSDQAVFDCDGDRQPDVFVFYNVVAGEGGVDSRHCFGGVDDGFEDEVVDGVFVAVCFFCLFVYLCSECHEWRGVYFDV